MRNAAGEPPGGWQPCGEEMDLSNPTTRTLTLKIFQPRGKDNPEEGRLRSETGQETHWQGARF